MSEIKLIALDLDGTLLDRNRRLSEENIRAMQRAMDRGILVVLASGRAIATMLPYAEQAELRTPIVSCNGAFVVNEEREEILHRSLPASPSEALIDIAEAAGLHINLYSRWRVYFGADTEFGREYQRRTGLQPEQTDYRGLSGIEPTKILFMDEPDRISEIHGLVQNRLGETDAQVVFSEKDYIEFLPHGITKGWGVSQLAAHLGFEAQEVAALGDHLNDLEMLQWAGFAGAMANARPELKAIADVEAGHHDESGAAHFIHQVLSR